MEVYSLVITRNPNTVKLGLSGYKTYTLAPSSNLIFPLIFPVNTVVY